MASGFRTFHPLKNDWNEEVYYKTSSVELENSMKLLEEAQDFLQNTLPKVRALLLSEIRKTLNKEKEQIRSFYLKESGLNAARFEAEWKRTIETIQFFENQLTAHYSFEKTADIKDEHVYFRKIKKAIGPVLVLGASNFPLAYSTIGGDTISALAAGCCVVVKAHPMHVGTSLQVANCIQKALHSLHFPKGIFIHVIDDGITLAQQLCLDNRIQAVGFTGSFKGGKALMDLAASRENPIPVFAEMGSLNPVIVHEGLSQLNAKKYAEKMIFSITNDAGQFCTKPGIVFVPDQEEGRFFVAELKKNLAGSTVSAMLHPKIFENFRLKTTEIKSISGIKYTERPGETNGICAYGILAEIDFHSFQKNQQFKEEIFGPFALLVYYSEFKELASYLKEMPGQLTSTMLYQTENQQVKFCQSILENKAGRVILNGLPTGVRVIEAIHHGGPYPASSDARFTAVGPDSIKRFQKEVCIQDENAFEN